MPINSTRTDTRPLQLCIWALVCWASAPAHSSDPPLTLAQAQTMAVARSRQIASQDLAVLSSQEMAVSAGQLPDPVLKLGIDNLPINGADRLSLTDDFMTMRRVGVMQEITSTDKRRARADIYERTADKTRAEKSVITAAIQRDTALAWLDTYYAEKMAAAIKDQVTQSRFAIEAAESAYRAGRSGQSDVLAARSALALIEDRASEIQQKATSARIVLARWTGNGLDSELADPPEMEAIRMNPVLLENQLEQHPQIAVMNQQISLAEADARLAQANKNTDWSVGLAYQQRSSAYSNMISIELSIPIQWDQGNRQNRELRAKQAIVNQAIAERDEVLREHVAQTRAMLSEWQNDRHRLIRFESELLPLAAERIAAVLAAYRSGKASLTDVLAARRDEIDVRIQSLQLKNETARLWAQLEFLTPTNPGAALNWELP